MHGLGNNFMVIDAIRQHISLTSEQIRILSRSDIGVGFDQCLLVEPPTAPDVDFNYRIYNANGSESGQCGNGARCLAKFIHRYELSSQSALKLKTGTTIMETCLNNDDTVTVNLGVPDFTTEKPIELNKIDLYTVDVGNPHAVILCQDINRENVAHIGATISTHQYFPQQTNVGFMQIIDKNNIKLRVYERGAGETSACGSGAVAAAAVGMKYHELDNIISIEMSGGMLNVMCKNQELFLTGPAEFVYEGVLF